MKNLTDNLFLKTILGRLLLGLFLLIGINAYNTMVRESYPDLDIPEAVVTTQWPGASPEQIEKEITKHLEDEIRSLKRLKTFFSGSFNSYSMIAVKFDADAPVADTMQLLRAAVDKAESEFPVDVGVEKPEVEQMSMAEAPVISWVLHGDVDDMVLTDIAKRVESQFESIANVKKVDLGGLREKSLHVQLKPDRLRALGVSPLLVRDRLQAANRDMSWGRFEGDDSTLSLYFSGRLDTPEKVRQLPITRLGDNRVVRLGEVAEVNLTLDKEISRTYFSLHGAEYAPGITLDVVKRPGSDTFSVINATQAMVTGITTSPDWPKGLYITRIADDGELINQSFGEISSSMMQAVLLVFLILMVLLSWRVALIAGMGLPVTLLASLAIIDWLGYSFNTTVMVGLVLAVGLLVDVFILVMEGMHNGRFVRRESFAKSAIQTVKTYGLPAFAGQMTTILAMIPLMMIGGVDGKFFRVLPVTITVCLVISLVVAFLICIPLSRYLLEHADISNEPMMDRITERFRNRLRDMLLNGPLKSKKRSLLSFATAIGVFIFSIVLAGFLPTLMYPPADDRKVGIAIELPPEATLEQAQQVADKVSVFFSEQPYIEKYIAYVGAKSPVTRTNIRQVLLPEKAWNQVGFTLMLVPKNEREKLSLEYLEPIRQGILEKLQDEAGLQVFIAHAGGNPEADDPIQINLIGPDYEALQDISVQVRDRLSQLPGVVDARDNFGVPLRQVRFEMLDEKLSFHGLNETAVAQQVRMAMEQDEFGSFKVAGISDDPDLRISMLWPSRNGEMGGPSHLSEMNLMQVITDDGRTVPFTDVVDFRIVNKPQVFSHLEGRRSITVQSRAEERTATQIMEQFIPILDEMKKKWPAGFDYRMGGEMAKSDDVYGDIGTAFTVAMFMIFILLSLMFGSMTQPVIILLVVPFAIMGTFIGYFLFNVSLSVSGLIGVVALAGIAVNNGIVLVGTMNKHLRSGMDVVQAAAQGASDRLRPILSTSLTTILGLMPLATSDPSWFPLCSAIIFGLISSTTIAMFVVPSLYILMTRPSTEPVRG
ncbi:MAG: efflux RND transporter permease subunit [Endozoicomonas sp.]